MVRSIGSTWRAYVAGSDEAVMEGILKAVTLADVDELVFMMTDFYEETATQFEDSKARSAFEKLFNDPRDGRVWFVCHQNEHVGYVVMTVGFSMEFGGQDAFVDDIYIRIDHRGAGLGRSAMVEVIGIAEDLGIHAIHLEVDRQNRRAQQLYRSTGFEARERYFLMTRLLT